MGRLCAMKGFNLSQVIRYGYPGLLLAAFLVKGFPADAKAYVEGAGAVLAPLIVLTVGSCLYTVYRHLIGEWLLYPIAHCIDTRLFVPELDARSLVAIFPVWGVSKGRIRDAYNLVRRQLVPDDLKKQVELAHAEVHILYLTALQMPLLYFVLGMNGWAAAAISVTTLFAAWAADVRQHRYEARAIRAKLAVPGKGGDQVIKDFLTEHRLLPGSP